MAQAILLTGRERRRRWSRDERAESSWRRRSRGRHCFGSRASLRKRLADTVSGEVPRHESSMSAAGQRLQGGSRSGLARRADRRCSFWRFMATVELCRVSLLLFAANRAFPASSAGRCCLALGIVLMLRGRSAIPEAGRLVEIVGLWRVRTASALRVQIPSVRDAHEDRSTSFPSFRGPTTGQLPSSRRPPAATPWQQSAARHGARPALSEGRCSAHVLWRHICSAAPARRPR